MLSCIVAIDKNYAIGKDNSLPWHLSDDLKMFKELTTNHSIIMGRKTYDSIGRPLPHRHNIIISRNKNLQISNCTIFNNLEQIKKLKNDKQEHFIIGGSQIYDLTFSMCNKLYLTEVNTIVKNADDFFPKINFSSWQNISTKEYHKNEKNDYDFTCFLWHRRLN